MKKISTGLIIVVLFLSISTLITASDTFSVEDYGQLREIRSLSISPDGKHLAYIQRGKDGDFFVVTDLNSGKMLGGANASAVKARAVDFLTNEQVILKTSDTVRALGIRGKWEQSEALVYSLKTKKIQRLLKKAKGLYRAQSGLGSIVGFNPDKREVYTPAYIEKGEDYNLFKVNLDTLRVKTHAKGNQHTIDWFVGSDGRVLAREEFAEKKQEHRVVAYLNGKWKKIYSKQTSVPEIAVVAVSSDESKLLFEGNSKNNDAIFSMDIATGAIEGPLYQESGVDIDAVLTEGYNRKMSGVLYSGLLPGFVYLDEQYQSDLASIQQKYPLSAVIPVSNNQDRSKIVVLVSGNQGADDYYLFDKEKRSLAKIASGYSNIQVENIAEIKPIRYKARDGLSISALMTWPVGINKTERKNLPLIVLPHGGPESYDQIQFDWLSQYFARKGYLVLQPNFRGSTGFGNEFKRAGRGKWGKEMQDDVTDGVKSMIKSGYVDPDRVCIIGASYGGYSALAGGAYTPDIYKCVISIAGVSDIPKMLKSDRRKYGRNHWVVSYWNQVLDNTKLNNLHEVSPVNAAQQFQAPLLLLHGRDDTIVPIDQSKQMYKAMNKAGKEVEFITLNGEDHWLSSSATRLELLKQVSSFLDKHNPVVLSQ